MWRLEWNSNPRPFGRKAMNVPMSHPTPLGLLHFVPLLLHRCQLRLLFKSFSFCKSYSVVVIEDINISMEILNVHWFNSLHGYLHAIGFLLHSQVFIFVLLGKRTSVDKPLLEYMSKKLNTT